MQMIEASHMRVIMFGACNTSYLRTHLPVGISLFIRI